MTFPRLPITLLATAALVGACKEDNQPPVVAPVESQAVAVGDTLTVNLFASDKDGDALTYSFAAPGVPITDLPAFDASRLQVRCPHLLIWGQDDTALLPEATEGLEEFCADLTRIEIGGADHWLHHQKPAEVATVIRDWMA